MIYEISSFQLVIFGLIEFIGIIIFITIISYWFWREEKLNGEKEK